MIDRPEPKDEQNHAPKLLIVGARLYKLFWRPLGDGRRSSG